MTSASGRPKEWRPLMVVETKQRRKQSLARIREQWPPSRGSMYKRRVGCWHRNRVTGTACWRGHSSWCSLELVSAADEKCSGGWLRNAAPDDVIVRLGRLLDLAGARLSLRCSCGAIGRETRTCPMIMRRFRPDAPRHTGGASRNRLYFAPPPERGQFLGGSAITDLTTLLTPLTISSSTSGAQPTGEAY